LDGGYFPEVLGGYGCNNSSPVNPQGGKGFQIRLDAGAAPGIRTGYG